MAWRHTHPHCLALRHKQPSVQGLAGHTHVPCESERHAWAVLLKGAADQAGAVSTAKSSSQNLEPLWLLILHTACNVMKLKTSPDVSQDNNKISNVARLAYAKM